MQTIGMASAWVGLILPGMIDDPGSLAGKISSSIPLPGPEPSQRRPLAILNRVTAASLMGPCARTMRSRVPWAANLVAALSKRAPVIDAICAATCSPKPAGALSPVPTAVPPMPASAGRWWRAASRRWNHQARRRSPTTPGRRSAEWRPPDASGRSRRPRPTSSNSAPGHPGAGSGRGWSSASPSGDVHSGGERVVAGLAHVHVVVGVDRLLGAERAADQLDAPVGDDLVHVHIGLGPRPGLPHIQREFLIQCPS